MDGTKMKRMNPAHTITIAIYAKAVNDESSSSVWFEKFQTPEKYKRLKFDISTVHENVLQDSDMFHGVYKIDY